MLTKVDEGFWRRTCSYGDGAEELDGYCVFEPREESTVIPKVDMGRRARIKKVMMDAGLVCEHAWEIDQLHVFHIVHQGTLLVVVRKQRLKVYMSHGEYKWFLDVLSVY